MSTEKTNGHDPLTVEMVGILREIRDELKRLDKIERHTLIVGEQVGALHKTVISLHEEQRKTNATLEAFRDETRGELLDIRGAIEGLTDRVDRLDKRAEKAADQLTGIALDLHELNEQAKKTDGLERRLAKVEAVVFKQTGTG